MSRSVVADAGDSDTVVLTVSTLCGIIDVYQMELVNNGKSKGNRLGYLPE